MSNNIRLYVTPETRAQIDRLLVALTAAGVDLKDNRGNDSISALVRYLVAQELRRQTADPDAPYPEAEAAFRP